MEKQLIPILKGAFSLLAAFVLILYFQSNISFKHSHYLSDGSMIEHTHPFSDQDGKQHKHTKSEIAFFSLLNPQSDLIQDFPKLNIKTTDIFLVSSILMEENIQLSRYPLNTLRGPPFC